MLKLISRLMVVLAFAGWAGAVQASLISGNGILVPNNGVSYQVFGTAGGLVDFF